MTKSELTVGQILDSAAALFLKKSYADVTMAQIARAARLTKGALYHHFKSKEDLYLALLLRDLEEKRALFERAARSGGSSRDRLARLTRAFFKLPRDRRRRLRLVRRDVNLFTGPVRDGLVRAYQSALPEQVEQILRDGIRSGELDPADPRLLSWHYVAMVEVVLSGYADRVLGDPEAKLEGVLDLFFSGARASEKSKRKPPEPVSIRVFDEWRDRPLDEALHECRELVEDPDYPTVKRWREAGGMVLGHFQVYFPEEIAHAAGMLPVKVRGAPIEANNAESRFGSYLCSIIKTSLELPLTGRLELDMFVSHPICDAARNLAAIWGRNHGYPCQILYLPQNPNSAHSTTYLQGEYDRIRRTVESVTGRSIGEGDLRRSIALFNRNRELLRELYRIKRETPWLISAEDAYCLVAVGGMIPREEHNELLESLLPQIREREAKAQDRIRIVFEGAFCEQPPLDLIRALGRTSYVVDDDFLVGLRYLTSDVPTEGDPLLQLAESYIERSSYSPVQHDLRKPKEAMLLERIKASGAEAVIVAAAKMCEPGLEEQVAYIHALEAEGIPHFVSEFEENMTSFEHLELQLETFAENLLFA